LKVLFFLNLTVDFPSEFAKNTHPEQFTGLVFNTQSGQVEILGQAVLLLKMRNYFVFYTYAGLVEFSKHHLLFCLFFIPLS
jgi:hypothetical protein